MDVVDDKFGCAEWTAMPSRAPRVIDPLIGFDCEMISLNLVGTHHVLIGEVTNIFVAERGSPLLYANRLRRYLSNCAHLQSRPARKEPRTRCRSAAFKLSGHINCRN